MRFMNLLKINQPWRIFPWLRILFVLAFAAGCAPAAPATVYYITPLPQTPAAEVEEVVLPTPIATRPVYDPGTLVDYTAQTGDTLPALAARFNTTIDEILAANPALPKEITTLYPGDALKIPIYYEPLWGNSFQILPDSLFINGPAQIGFDTRAFVDEHPGWLKNYSTLAGGKMRRGGEVIDFVALNYSISPRLLLALAEYQAGALTSEVLPEEKQLYPLGYQDQFHKGIYLQLIWAANLLNNGYYEWRGGTFDTITRLDGSIEHPDPWQNAATVALQNYYSGLLSLEDYQHAIYSEGFYRTYTELFGEPWQNAPAHLPGNLQQPDLTLPFELGKTWTYTGGPHAGWGDGAPLAAIDFAPPASIGGCAPSVQFVTAVADGQIVRAGDAQALLDLDGDADERTGWVIFYLHLASNDLIQPGVLVKTGDFIGHPSCEGGSATGTHVHIARKYNGEWVSAGGPLAFSLEGWTAGYGAEAYLGTLKKHGRVVEACTCSDPASQITAGLYD